MRQCEKIHGIPVDDIIYLLNQFADDMNIASMYDQHSLTEIFRILETFCLNTGFTISYEKTSIYRLGPLVGSSAELYTASAVAWTDDPINVLGVTVSHQPQDQIRSYDSVIEKSKSVLSRWQSRNLSLIGKIMVINSLVSSLFVYQMAVLPTMTEQQFQICDLMFGEFIWSGKKAKIPLKTLQSCKKTGGLWLANLRTKDLAIKVSWINTLQKDQKMANLAFHLIGKTLREDLWLCNIRANDISDCILQHEENPFWFDAVTAWAKYHYTANEDTASRFIWLNSLIRINQRPVMWNNCYRKGLKYVVQLYRHGSLISVKTAFQEFDLTPINFNSLVSAIPQTWRRQAKELVEHQTQLQSNTVQLKASSVYNELIADNSNSINKCVSWNEELGCDMSISEFHKFCKDIHRTTNIPKLRSFQYRLLQRAVILNMHLFRWGLHEDNLCSLCEMSKETYSHLFKECSVVTRLWTSVANLIKNYTADCINISTKTVILDRISNKSITNTICLITKQYIYRQRCQKKPINFIELKAIVWQMERIEKYTAIKNGNLSKHIAKWYPDSNAKNLAISVQENVEETLNIRQPNCNYSLM